MSGQPPATVAEQPVRVLSGSPVRTERIADVLAWELATIKDIRIVFMPKVEVLARPENQELQDDLIEKFFVPRFFFTDIGFDSNGFFGSKEVVPEPNPNTDSGNDADGAFLIYATWGRFLSKKVKFEWLDYEDRGEKKVLPTKIGGDWHYMSFYTLHLSESKGLLFCFDLDADVQQEFEKTFTKMLAYGASARTYLPHFLCPAIVDQFDKDVWTFRKPIRAFEQNRLTSDNVEVDKLHERYQQMHELARHVIHISETLKVATRTLEAIVEDHALRCWDPNPPRRSLNPLQSLKYRLNNLEDRGQAFVNRLNNEIQLAFNIAGANQFQHQLEQSRKDSKTFTDTIALLTLLFLPGTFVSGFFGMNFFSLEVADDGSDKWCFSRWFWIFFACTVPLTLLCLLLFAMNIPVIELMREWGIRIRKWRDQRRGAPPASSTGSPTSHVAKSQTQPMMSAKPSTLAPSTTTSSDRASRPASDASVPPLARGSQRRMQRSQKDDIEQVKPEPLSFDPDTRAPGLGPSPVAMPHVQSPIVATMGAGT